MIVAWIHASAQEVPFEFTSSPSSSLINHLIASTLATFTFALYLHIAYVIRSWR